MHIPPGVDVHSTLHRTRNLIIVPFLQPGPRNTVLRLAADPARHVELVVTAHIHRFGYRIIEAPHVPPVPVLVAPAISPIFANDPAFLRATMSADGHIVGLEEYARLQTSGIWRDIGGLKALGVSELTGPALVHLHARLAREPALRETYSRLYSGEIRRPEIDRGNWRSYWCAATNFASTEYRGCLDEGGLSFLTRRGVGLVAAAALAVVVVLGAAASIVIGARRRRAR